MKVGDLIRDKEHPGDVGIIVAKAEDCAVNTYRILDLYGGLGYYDKSYVEKGCEVVSEGR